MGTYIWLLTAFGVFVSKNYKRLSNQNKILILGLLSGIISYLTQNEFSFGNTPIVTLFWVMMGLCISIVKINEAERSLSTEGGGSRIKECYEDRKLRGWEGVKLDTAQLPRFPPSQISVFCKWIGCGIALTAIGFAAVLSFDYTEPMPVLNTEEESWSTKKKAYLLLQTRVYFL